MKKIITILAACLMGIGQIYAQGDVYAKDLYEQFSTRAYETKVRLEIWAMDYFEYGYFPEYQVRIDYFLCKALTHEVTSVETRTVAFNANDFSEKDILLTAPAGYQIRDDVHFDVQTKVNGQFKSRLAGLRSCYKNPEKGRLQETLCVYLEKDRGGDPRIMEGEFHRFYYDNITGLEYNRMHNPKLNKPYFTLDSRGYAMPGSKQELRYHVRTLTENEADKRWGQMKPDFWPKKVAPQQLKHTMIFALCYENGEKPLPPEMNIYLTMEAPLYKRDGTFSCLDNVDSGDAIKLMLTSKSRKPWIQGEFKMDDNERLFVYPFWMVVAENVLTGKFEVLGVGLSNLTDLNSDTIHVIDVTGTFSGNNLKISSMNQNKKN